MRAWVLGLLVAGCSGDPAGTSADGAGAGGGPDAARSVDDGGGARRDAASLDGGAAADGAPVLLEPPPLGPYDLLSDSGLYVDIDAKVVRGDVLPFAPEFELWSDGAEKARWIWLPPGEQVNTAAMGRWVVPVGTTVWKEFSDPDTGARRETRVIQRLPDDTDGPRFFMAAFVWDDDETDAARDTTPAADPPRDIPAGCSTCDDPPCAPYPAACHVVPQASLCNRCHGGERSRLLGFSAVQLSHHGAGATLADLAGADLLTAPPPPDTSYAVPGTPLERAAIGTLHANCGHCHDPVADQQACWGVTGFGARVHPGEDAVADTALWQTAVDQDLEYWVDDAAGNHTDPPITRRIASGDPAASAVWYRMSVREWGHLAPDDDHQQMPPIATHEVDAGGLGAVETWIESLGP